MNKNVLQNWKIILREIGKDVISRKDKVINDIILFDKMRTLNCEILEMNIVKKNLEGKRFLVWEF